MLSQAGITQIDKSLPFFSMIEGCNNEFSGG
jgi:hypothetical protein